jgi:hypothetical protein
LRKILIITPHYPPSNLAAVHRSRLFAQHLPKFGWEPVILTLDETYYEEALDWNLHKLLPFNQRIEKVSAYPVTKPRIIGDIGLRGFFQLRKRALEIIKSEQVDFVYIPIPSFYVSLIGPYLYKTTGVKYGIDYIDPWVHHFPGSDQIFSRHWFSTQLAKILEPIAVKYASLITGVSDGYFKPVLERNPRLKLQAVTAAMPYGGEEKDHDFIRKGAKGIGQYTDVLPQKSDKSFRFVYAGTVLPKAHKPLEEILKALSKLNDKRISGSDQQISFYFIGTLGKIRPVAEKFNLWNKTVFEHPDRISYLDVLRNLDAADGIFILGSTESHYTPSKVYQGVLSQKPILAILHQESTAVKILQDSKAGLCVLMDGENDLDTLGVRFSQQLTDYMKWTKVFDQKKVNNDAFEKYSAKAITLELVNSLNKIFND